MSRVMAETTADEETSRALQARRAEREALLARLTRMLEDDERVAAAWLFGSAGRGEADDLSDLDLRVVVYDEYIAGISEGRQAYAAQAGEAVLFQEAPQNRPAGGAFLLTLYAGEFGPQEVDWTWEPLSTARLWPGTRLLLNRAGLARQGEMPWGYQPRPALPALEEAAQRVGSFWAMLLIVAKYAARSPREATMGLVGMPVQLLLEVVGFLGLTPRYTMESLPQHGRPEEKMALLRGLAGHMEALMPVVEARGGVVPWAALPHAHRFLDLVEAVTGGKADVKTLAEALRARRDDRAALLACITRMLDGDDRIAAAWLFGSLGRGEEDDWSDIDIFVAVADADFSEVSQGRRAFAARAGEPLIVVEAPSCAPPGGAFLTACYDTPSGLLIVDWYWQPQSRARIWQPTRLLFDRVGLPHLDGPGGWNLGATPGQTWQERAERQVNALWWGLAHAAKYLARSPRTWEEEGQMSYQRQELEDAYRFFGVEPPSLGDWAWPERPAGKVDLLRQIASQAEALMPLAANQGVPVPPEVGPSLGRLLDVVEQACREAGD